jgi:hypothetical protein
VLKAIRLPSRRRRGPGERLAAAENGCVDHCWKGWCQRGFAVTTRTPAASTAIGSLQDEGVEQADHIGVPVAVEIGCQVPKSPTMRLSSQRVTP